MKRLITFIALSMVASTLLSGCVVAMGNRGTKHDATLGRELVDLKEAKDKGVITPEEYEAQRARLLLNQK